jgi:cysteine-S-conjugate beta-lyase
MPPPSALWRDQFSGASGLFSLVLRPEEEGRFAERFNRLSVFRLGASWGGTHSLLAPLFLDAERTVDRTYATRPIVRVSVGLEAKEDLLEDLLGVLAG